MKISDLTTILNEVSMSPSSLKAMASKVNAKVGIEFEMYVPNVKSLDRNGNDDEDEYIDADDQRVSDIHDVVYFFWNNGDSGASRTDRDGLKDRLQSEYDNWNSNYKKNEWLSHGEDYLKDYIKDNVIGEDDVIEKMKDNDELSPIAALLYNNYSMYQLTLWYQNSTSAMGELSQEQVDELFNTMPIFLTTKSDLIDEMAEDSWKFEDSNYDAAKDEYLIHEADEGSEREFFDEEYGRDASDFRNIAAEFDFYWPQELNPEYNSHGDPDEISDSDLGSVADDFEQFTGFDVAYSTDYHSVKRDNSTWIIEPDSSLDERRVDEDHGLEFVSPPMSVSEMINTLEKVQSYAEKEGCYTDDSCGLHINVSVEGMDNLDIFKLLVFLGDQYILTQYGRQLTMYCKSAYAQMQKNAKAVLSPTQLNNFLSTIGDKAALKLQDKIVTALMTGIMGQKYISTNLHMSKSGKVDYIEFRSPGGDWLGENSKLITNTIYRFVAALDIACDADRYKQEYAKKLYKAMAPVDDPLANLLAKKMSGTLTPTELKSALRLMSQSHMTTSVFTKPALIRVYSAETMTLPPEKQYTLDVLAKSSDEAIKTAVKTWKITEATSLNFDEVMRQLKLKTTLLTKNPSPSQPLVSRPSGYAKEAWYLVSTISASAPPALVKAYTTPEAKYYACLNNTYLIPYKATLNTKIVEPLSVYNGKQQYSWCVYDVNNPSRQFNGLKCTSKEEAINLVRTAAASNYRGYELLGDTDATLDAVPITPPIE